MNKRQQKEAYKTDQVNERQNFQKSIGLDVIQKHLL